MSEVGEKSDVVFELRVRLKSIQVTVMKLSGKIVKRIKKNL